MADVWVKYRNKKSGAEGVCKYTDYKSAIKRTDKLTIVEKYDGRPGGGGKVIDSMKAAENGNIVIDGSGITDFVPVDTITSWESEPCKMSSFDPKTGTGISCAAIHLRSEVRYQVLRNAAGVTKEVRIEEQ